MIRTVLLTLLLASCGDDGGAGPSDATPPVDEQLADACAAASHDEDRDCTADDADPCPSAAGIEACSPDPATELVEFISFGEATTLDRWKPAPANTSWGWDGESLRFNGLASMTPLTMHDTSALRIAKETWLVTEIEIDQIDETTTALVGVRIGATAAGGYSYACQLAHAAGAANDAVQAVETGIAPRAAVLPRLAAGDRVTLSMHFTPSGGAPTLECRAQTATGGDVTIAHTKTMVRASGSIAVVASGSRAHVRWIARYERIP